MRGHVCVLFIDGDCDLPIGFWNYTAIFFPFYYLYTKLLQHSGHKVLDIFILVNYPSCDSYADQAVGNGSLTRFNDQSYLLLSN